MTEIIEGVSVGIIADDDKCPICEKKTHETVKKKDNLKGDLTSKPDNLGCSKITKNPRLPNYTTAAHHLIPAIQCLAKFPRLSQICDAVGYDVNNSVNGLSLPTVGQGENNKYTEHNLKYGDLEKSQCGKEGAKIANPIPAGERTEVKKNIAFTIMKGLDRQWHVGHHDWKKPQDLQVHVDNYDKLVKVQLRDLEKDIVNEGVAFCEENEDDKPGKDILDLMDSLSEDIKSNVKEWKNYFVSSLAFQFGSER